MFVEKLNTISTRGNADNQMKRNMTKVDNFQAVEGFLLATTRAKGNNSSTGLGLISSGDDCCG